jgi:hypothetical protein
MSTFPALMSAIWLSDNNGFDKLFGLAMVMAQFGF